MRFINYLPVIKEELPVFENELPEISISYYLFSKWSQFEQSDQIKDYVIGYAYETAYAYRQLLRHTNIEECGQVQIFIDEACLDIMMPYFESIGLDRLAVPINVPKDIRLSGYIPQLNHEVLKSRYRFHIDADLWFANRFTEDDKFDWKKFYTALDTHTSDNAIYGQPIQKPEWIYQVNYAGHDRDELVSKARATLEQVFKTDIPKAFERIASVDLSDEYETTEVADWIKCLGGWFVGVRAKSAANIFLHTLYRENESVLSDDEGLFSLLFEMFPWMEDVEVIQNRDYPQDWYVPQTSIAGFLHTYGTTSINVGASEFTQHTKDYKLEIEELIEYFGE